MLINLLVHALVAIQIAQAERHEMIMTENTFLVFEINTVVINININKVETIGPILPVRNVGCGLKYVFLIWIKSIANFRDWIKIH